MNRGLTISRHTDPDVAHLFRRMIKWLIIVNIIVGTFTVFNLVIYPRYIYEAPEPIRVSEPVDQLWPNEV